jgi:hypothetical protein
MKKIVFIIVALFIAIVTMAYLYFSGLSSETKNSQHSLYVATANSPLIFSFEYEKSVVDILQGQDLLKDIIGAEKAGQLSAFSQQILSIPGMTDFIGNQSVYVSLHPGLNKSIDFLYSTQINPDFNGKQLLETLKAGKLPQSQEAGLFKVILGDSSNLYLGIKDNLLLLSTENALVKRGLGVTKNQSQNFASFIQGNSRISKNSLAELYVNFETLPKLLAVTMPGKLSGELAPLDNQQAFAALVYNFSKEKILFTGTTVPQNADNYYSLFATEEPQQINITNILPQNTATYTAYAIKEYRSFQGRLKEMFLKKKVDKKMDKIVTEIKSKYRINLDNTLPGYFKNQFITFQLSTAERLGAVSLTNGDKLSQLLLELSTDYDDDVKQLKVSGILNLFFGQPFSHFDRPYYSILDNYMIVANNPATLNNFLSNYRNNKLLINDKDYSNSIDQLPGSSNVNFYIGLENAANNVQKTIFLPLFKHVYSDEGLKQYSSIFYQLSGDNKKFLTNLLLVKKQSALPLDSLSGSN